MTWWRYVRRELRNAFPDSDIRILPRPGVGPNALQVCLGGDIFLVDRHGILKGPQDLAFSTVYVALLDAFRTREDPGTDPFLDL